MADDTVVRWEGATPLGCLAMPLGCLPFGIVLGLVLDRYQVTVADFTRRQVRLGSRTAVRTVQVTNLLKVTVTHSGYTDQGYRQTSLEVVWRGGQETIDGLHDPALAASLRRLLPQHVKVQHIWEELEDRPPDA